MANELPTPRWSLRDVAVTAAVVTTVAIAFGLMVAVVWVAAEGFIIIFAGILLAVLLDAGARGLGRIVPWRRRVRLMVVFVVTALFIATVLMFGGAILVAQANHFVSAMKGLLSDTNRFIQDNGLGLFPPDMQLSALLPKGGVLFGSATTIATSTLDIIMLVTAILFLGAFFAWEPRTYKAVVLSLLPKTKRERVNVVLDRCAHAMREWLIGQGVSMFVIFVFSISALMLVGMPYPALLAVQAGLLTFIPTLGPFVAGVVIILAGLSQSLVMAAYGLGTYVIIQFLETHLVTPLVQERTVRLPPASILGLQILAGMLFGIPGVIFVVPAAAAGKTLVQELYVEDYLGGAWHAQRGNSRSPVQRLFGRILGEPGDI